MLEFVKRLYRIRISNVQFAVIQCILMFSCSLPGYYTYSYRGGIHKSRTDRREHVTVRLSTGRCIHVYLTERGEFIHWTTAMYLVN